MTIFYWCCIFITRNGICKCIYKYYFDVILPDVTLTLLLWIHEHTGMVNFPPSNLPSIWDVVFCCFRSPWCGQLLFLSGQILKSCQYIISYYLVFNKALEMFQIIILILFLVFRRFCFVIYQLNENYIFNIVHLVFFSH